MSFRGFPVQTQLGACLDLGTQPCYEAPGDKFEKWRTIRGSVGGVGGVLEWVACLSGWRASVGGVLAWVAC